MGDGPGKARALQTVMRLMSEVSNYNQKTTLRRCSAAGPRSQYPPINRPQAVRRLNEKTMATIPPTIMKAART
jgi:hypothetical protein